MALRDLSNAIVASPNQSSSIFGVGGAHPVRFKNLYVLRFVRKSDTTDDWKQGLTFLAKSIERPSVQPVTEEINQYNRKRVIHTGVKYNAISCQLYDTADGAAHTMWAQYANYYFGDFGHVTSDYKDDIINSEMLGKGYGFGISPTTTAEPNGINSQFFFDRIEVYQVWGNEYTSYQLVNPRIASFNPDDLDYEANTVSMITMSIQFETVHYENSGKSQPLASNPFLAQTFGAEFSGQTYDPQGMQPRNTNFTSTGSVTSSGINPNTNITGNSAFTDPRGFNITLDSVEKASKSGLGLGTIDKFGSFNFGDFSSSTSPLPTELSTISGGIDNLATNADTHINSIGSQFDIEQTQLGPAAGLSDIFSGVSLSNTLSDVPQAQVNTVDWSKDVISDFSTFGYDSYNPNPHQPSPATSDAVVSTSPKKAKAVSLGPIAIAIINARAVGSAQIGVRTSNKNVQLPFIKEPPKPKVFFTGYLNDIEEQSDIIVMTGKNIINSQAIVSELPDIIISSGTRIGRFDFNNTEESDGIVFSAMTVLRASSIYNEEDDNLISVSTIL